MARRRVAEPVGDLRDELAARWRAFAHESAERVGLPVNENNYYASRADALERGEAVRVANWELPTGLLRPGALRREPYWYVVTPDGRVQVAA